MKTAAVRDLRNHFSKLEAWLAEGEQIQIQKRGLRKAAINLPAQQPCSDLAWLPPHRTQPARRDDQSVSHPSPRAGRGTSPMSA